MPTQSAAARSWEDLDDPSLPTSRRSWASNVPYDILDAEPELALPLSAPGRIGRAAAPTQYLRAVPRSLEEALPVYPSRMPIIPPAYRSATAALPGIRPVLVAGGALTLAVGLFVAASMVVNWTQIKLDDMTYGNPRTTHLDALVGNGDSAAQPTHFIALNLNRQVSILELPGGDISKAVAITGPYLFGDGEDLTPIKLQVADINGDSKPDLLVTVKNEQLAYINDKGNFRPITPAEKAQIEQAQTSATK